MKANVGNTDKMIRVAVALLLGILIYAEVITGIFATIAGVVSIVLVLTTLMSFCGLYAMLGIHTCKRRS